MEGGEVDSMGVIKGVILLCSILIYPSIDHRTLTFTAKHTSQWKELLKNDYYLPYILNKVLSTTKLKLRIQKNKQTADKVKLWTLFHSTQSHKILIQKHLKLKKLIHR